MRAKPGRAVKWEQNHVKLQKERKKLFVRMIQEKIPPTIARVALKELYFSIGQITLAVCSKRLGLKLLGFVSYFEKLTHFRPIFFRISLRFYWLK